MGSDEEQTRYRRISLIDAGGMGEVYLARDPVLDRNVALKVLAKDVAANREFAQRLAHEARTMAALDTHPNIVQIFDVIWDRNELCLVLEFVNGVNFRTLMATPEFTEQLAFKLLHESALALAYLHDQKSIIHRDIKPANILIRSRDQNIKLIDFGIARLESDARLTKTGLAVGTEKYMAPEILQAGHDATFASDIWSLGTVLREAREHLRTRTRRTNFGALDSVILEMTDPDPSKRPSAQDLANRDFSRDSIRPTLSVAAEAPTVLHIDPVAPSEEVILPTELFDFSSHGSKPDPVFEHGKATTRIDPATTEPAHASGGNGAAIGRARVPVGTRWLVAIVAIASILYLLWFGMLTKGRFTLTEDRPQSSALASPDATLPATDSQSQTPATTQSSLDVPMAGPWSPSELNELLLKPYYRVAASLTPSSVGLELSAVRYEKIPLGEPLQKIMDNQTELPGQARQYFSRFQLMENKGKIAFSAFTAGCDRAGLPDRPISPGFYLMVPMTDQSSTFTGHWVELGSGGNYALVAASCNEGTLSSTGPLLSPGAAPPGQIENLRFSLPLRPDGSWDKASNEPLGLVLVAADGRIVLLEA